jgi:Xaa-Pro aminopeptidase
LQVSGNSIRQQEGQKVLISDKASVAVAEALGRPYITIERSPIADFKSLKNANEIDGFRACHIRDGSALVRYFAWLEEQLDNGAELSESQGADQLEKFRGRVIIVSISGGERGSY